MTEQKQEEQKSQFKFVIDEKTSTDKPEDKKPYVFINGKFTPIVGINFEQQQSKIRIPTPERNTLKREIIGATEEVIQGSPQTIFPIEKIDYTDNGIFIYHKGLLYPKKGFPYPEACQANNVAKRALVSLIRSFGKNPLMALFLLRKKTFKKFLHEYCSFAEIVLSPYFFKSKYYSKTAKEIKKFIFTFLTEIRFKEDAETPGIIIAHMFEFDDAYMFMLQDIMNETSKEKLLENPAKELSRLFAIFNERESNKLTKEKIKALFFLIKGVFFVSSMKRAFKKAIESCNIENFKMEECDVYQVLRWKSHYDFLGESFETRIKRFLQMHKGIIPNFKVAVVD